MIYNICMIHLYISCKMAYIIYHIYERYMTEYIIIEQLFFNGRTKHQWRDHLKWHFLAEFANYLIIYTDVVISHGRKHVLPQSAQLPLMSSSMPTGYCWVTPRFSIYPWFQGLSQLEHCQSACIALLHVYHLQVNCEQNHIRSLEN